MEKYPVLNKKKAYGVVYGGGRIAFEQNGHCYLADGMHVKDPKGEHILEEAPEPLSRVEELESVIAKLQKQLEVQTEEKEAAKKEIAPAEEVIPMNLGTVDSNPETPAEGEPDDLGMEPINLETCKFAEMKVFLKANNVKMKNTDNQNDLLAKCKEVNDGLENR